MDGVASSRKDQRVEHREFKVSFDRQVSSAHMLTIVGILGEGQHPVEEHCSVTRHVVTLTGWRRRAGTFLHALASDAAEAGHASRRRFHATLS